MRRKYETRGDAVSPPARRVGAGPLVALGLAMALLAPPAAAYILPAPLILSQLHSTRAELKLRRLLAEGERLEAGAIAYPVWDGIQAGKARRLELKRPEGTQVQLSKKDKIWRFALGSPAGQPQPNPEELVLRLLTDPRGKMASTLAWLKGLGVDTTVVSFDRINGRVAFVIGAQPGQLNRPQLWVDKELFVPLRLLLPSGEHSRELRLSGYNEDPTKALYPGRMELLVDGQLRWRTDYKKVKANPRLAKRLFSTR